VSVTFKILLENSRIQEFKKLKFSRAQVSFLRQKPRRGAELLVGAGRQARAEVELADAPAEARGAPELTICVRCIFVTSAIDE
jgi:hypothetical protein